MGALDEFTRLMKEQGKVAIKPQLVWATVKEVDWEAKKMIATDLIDGLDYFDVLLGIGSVYKKPKIGTKCMLGVLGNNSSATFLVEAEATEEIIFSNNKSFFQINESGFAIQKNNENLKSVLNDFIDEVNKIVVLQGTTINVAAVAAIKQRLNTILID